MKLLIINGPNLNFLGIREKHLYGSETYDSMIDLCKSTCDEFNIDVDFYQSNHEGALVDRIQQAYFDKVDGIIINPGAYTHTSIALLDAVKAVMIPCIEVHVSKVEEREDFRQISYIRLACIKTITGEGIQGYIHAIKDMQDYLGGK